MLSGLLVFMFGLLVFVYLLPYLCNKENERWVADLRKWREYADNADHDMEGIGLQISNLLNMVCFSFLAYVNAVENLVQDKLVKLTEVSSKYIWK